MKLTRCHGAINKTNMLLMVCLLLAACDHTMERPEPEVHLPMPLLPLADCDYFVDSVYSGVEDGSFAQPYRTIQRALTRAGSGERICVRPGLYRENVQLTRGVSLISRRIGAAILHGGATRSGGHATVVTAEAASLMGFTIMGGYTGVICRGNAPIIQRNIIRGNYGDGGIKALDGCDATIENNTILGNLGNATNGLAIGIYVEDASPTIRNNIIVGNDIGFAPYQATSVESYNNIWGNRRDFGYAATPGTGTLSVDPRFQNAALDDYRLAADSPVRDAGDPAPVYHDADGSRNDMGAFDADGGYLVSLPVQELFVESVLNAIDTDTGLRLNGTSRFAADVLFWFDASGRGTQGETDARSLISTALPVLSDGRYSALFHDEVTPPATPCHYVTVSFGTPSGQAYRLGVDASCRDPDLTLLERNGANIIGGQLHLASRTTDGFLDDASAVDTLLHELEHVAGIWHSFRGRNVIGQGQGCCLGDYSREEKQAFNLLYAYPAGTTLDRFITDEKLTHTALHPLPRIDTIMRWDGTSARWVNAKTNPGAPDSVDYWARPGDYLILQGSRLTLRWSTELRTSSRPADYTLPTVHFGHIAFNADLDHQRCPTTLPITPCAADEPSNTWAGSPTRFLKVQVPMGASSGWIMVRARNLESNPVWLEIH